MDDPYNRRQLFATAPSMPVSQRSAAPTGSMYTVRFAAPRKAASTTYPGSHRFDATTDYLAPAGDMPDFPTQNDFLSDIQAGDQEIGRNAGLDIADITAENPVGPGATDAKQLTDQMNTRQNAIMQRLARTGRQQSNFSDMMNRSYASQFTQGGQRKTARPSSWSQQENVGSTDSFY